MSDPRTPSEGDAAAQPVGATPPPAPPAGWYDDGSARQRWFDGTQWTDHYAPTQGFQAQPESLNVASTADSATSATSGTTDYKPGDIVNGHQLTVQEDGRKLWVPIPGQVSTPETPKKSRRGLLITLGAVGAVVLLFIILGNLNRPAGNNTSQVADSSVEDDAKPAPKPDMVTVPTGLVGMTANDADAALAAVGLTATYDGEPTAKVLSISPTTASVEVGSTIRLTVEQPPQLTLAQENAVGQAESYLNYTSFSRSGLIGQLEYEGYTTEEATFAVDYVNPDWNVQAAGKAESYLSYSSFSREGLYDQLIYEGFTPEQVEAGLAAVGY
jgi:hypothetical protein